MKVLVTGGTSLLALATVQRLLERGDTVRCLQRGALPAPLAPHVEERHADIRDTEAVRDAAKTCEAIIHAAAKVGVVGEPSEYRAVNVGGTRNVLDGARAHGVERVVYVSSPSVAHGGEPLVGAPAAPALTTSGRAPYPATKAEAERLALAASGHRLAVVAVRPHLVWGPGDTQLVGRIVQRARAGRLAVVGTGAALVDSTYVDNAALALLAALDRIAIGSRIAGKPYVIANFEPRPIRELLEGICRAAGVAFAPRHVPPAIAVAGGRVVEAVWKRRHRTDDPPLTRFLAEQLATAHWFDPRPARDDLGYRPAVTIDDGLARLTAWFHSV